MGRETNLFKQLLELLPEGWESKAKELGAFQRAREIKTPEDLLRLILIYITEGQSFAGTSALVSLSEMAAISKVAVFKRMQKCGEWLKWLCQHICRKAGLLVEKPKWLENKNVILFDGSHEGKYTEPDQYQYYMLHYSMELFTLCVREFLITDNKTGEKLSNFSCLGKDDIAMADRAYTTLTGLAYLKERGCGYVLRFQTAGFNLYNENKDKIDLLKVFSGLLEGETADIRVYCLINGQYEPLRICAMRKYKEDEEAGLKRIEETNRRKQGDKAASPLQQGYNRYIILITSLDEKDVPCADVLNLYRMRWQIELAFKRLKSIFRYNEMPARKPENIKTWFYSTLLLAALCETLVNTGRFSPSGEPR